MHFPVHVELRRSRLLTFLLFLAHILAAACVWVLPWPALPRDILLSVIAVSAWRTQRPTPVGGLRLTEHGGLAVVLSAAAEPLSVSIASGTVVFSQLVVLRVRNEGQGRLRPLVLLPDSMSAEQFRVLRLWLRWQADPKDRVEGDV